ncbi:MAG: trypsin-like peptidase domain-containing protein, partial [Victivallales bacterium]|nr:trypsin-like peptidase domain-containing protein [Victivallales bacterium]
MNKCITAVFALAVSLSLAGVAKESKPISESEAVKAALQVEDAFSQVIESAKPAVVVITNKQTPKMGRRVFDGSNPMDMLPDEWYEFFGLPRRSERDTRGRHRRERERPQAVGKGSGVFIRENGLLLTNHHVIKDCDYLEVKTADGTVYDNEKDKKAVTIVGYDEESDLAVLQLADGKKEDFPYLPFANSDKLRVGQWAIAIGAPFNLDYSVTIGCVSQKGRHDMGTVSYEDYIQTDASINPGNSGGPLLNIRGEIIGINEFIVTGGPGSRGSVGVGFAIASNLANRIANALISDGEVVRPFLGISMQDLNHALKEAYGVDHGVVVRETIEGEAAEKAGVKAGDIIVKLGDKDVHSPHELMMRVTDYKPGDKIVLHIRRGDQDKKITVKAGSRNEYAGKDERGQRRKPQNSSVRKGELGEQLGLELKEEDDHVVIADVLEDGPAEQAGDKNDDKLQAGDVIYEVNRQEVESISDVREALKKSTKTTVLLYVGRRTSRNSLYKFLFALP